MKNFYLQRLLDLSQNWDKVFYVLKHGYSDEKMGNWIVKLLFYAIFDFKFYKSVSKILAIVIGILVMFGVIKSKNIDIYLKVILITAIVIILIMSNAITYLFKMIDFKNEKYFHLGAYRTLKKPEYNAFVQFFPLSDFSFKGLYDEIYEHNPMANEIEILKRQKLEMEIEHNKFVNKSKSDYESLIKTLEDQNNQIVLLIKLLKDINIILYQITNGYFKSSSLLMVSGFTVFEQHDKKLIKIIDEGTTGKTNSAYNIPLIITKNSPAILRALKSDQKYSPEIDIPYENHYVMSLKMQMENNKIWVFNYQADFDDEKALFFLLNNDILDVREVFRLTHALCLILQKRGVDKCGKKMP